MPKSCIEQLRAPVVDDNPFMRAVVRSLLSNIGVKKILEAGDGIAALEKIREDIRRRHPRSGDAAAQWPGVGADRVFSRISPTPDIPIIMLSAHVEHFGASSNWSSSA